MSDSARPVVSATAHDPDSEASERSVDPIEAELVAAISADDSALGDVWNRLREGQTFDEIAEARGASTSNFIYIYRHHADVILGRAPLPTAPTMAQGAARAVRRLLKRSPLSEGAAARLGRLLADLEGSASDPEERLREVNEASASTSAAENSATPGIYVYSFPHYLRYPYDEDSGHTMLKVGHSGRDTTRRFREQARTTALPEDPVLLRVYPVPEEHSGQVERLFHAHLEAADHFRSGSRMGGTEWFCTTVRFLDSTAKLLGLDVQVISDMGDAH